jgi:membrane-associated protein
MFESLFNLLTDAPLAYAIVFGVAAGDAVLPALPGESAVILAGVLAAAESSLVLGWVIAAAAAGAFVGDNTSYWIGRSSGRALCPWLQGGRTRAIAQWARQALDRRGGLIIVTARYIPGGRTVATLTSGITRYPYRSFGGWAALAAVSWALYAALLGYLGGRVFHDKPWLAVLIAFAVAAGLGLVVEALRRARSGR